MKAWSIIQSFERLSTRYLWPRDTHWAIGMNPRRQRNGLAARAAQNEIIRGLRCVALLPPVHPYRLIAAVTFGPRFRRVTGTRKQEKKKTVSGVVQCFYQRPL